MSNPTPVQAAFDTAIECIQWSIVRNAQEIELLMRKGKHANADMIALFRAEAAKKLRALEFIKTQTGWQQTDAFVDMSHQWEDVL